MALAMFHSQSYLFDDFWSGVSENKNVRIAYSANEGLVLEIFYFTTSKEKAPFSKIIRIFVPIKMDWNVL